MTIYQDLHERFWSLAKLKNCLQLLVAARHDKICNMMPLPVPKQRIRVCNQDQAAFQNDIKVKL